MDGRTVWEFQDSIMVHLGKKMHVPESGSKLKAVERAKGKAEFLVDFRQIVAELVREVHRKKKKSLQS